MQVPCMQQPHCKYSLVVLNDLICRIGTTLVSNQGLLLIYWKAFKYVDQETLLNYSDHQSIDRGALNTNRTIQEGCFSQEGRSLKHGHAWLPTGWMRVDFYCALSSPCAVPAHYQLVTAPYLSLN